MSKKKGKHSTKRLTTVEFIRRAKKVPGNKYDFYLLKLNILIEYDGMQHFKPIKFWGEDDALRRQQHIDKLKNAIAGNVKIRLIRSKYTNFERLDVKYLKRRLNIKRAISN